MAAQEKEPRNSDGPSKVVKEKVKGSIHFPDGMWTRITGKAKVIDSHALRFEDGTEVDLRFAMDAPELEQKASIGGSLYPCGKEAARFLGKLIGDRTVTFFVDGDVVDGKKPGGPCFVGETHLQTEMVRNGWAISAHSGMEPWEITAREKKRGLWRGQFVVPKQWRTGERLPGEK